MTSPELQFIIPNPSRTEHFRHQALQELAWDVRELESMLLPMEEQSALASKPITKERLARIHDLFDALTDGKRLIPDKVDEDAILELNDDLIRLYKQLVDIKRGINPPEDPFVTPEAERVKDRIVEELSEIAKNGAVETSDKGNVLRAIMNINTEKAARLRWQLFEDSLTGASEADKVQNHLFINSLIGADTPQDHALRERLLESGESSFSILTSLTGASSPESLALRKRFCNSGTIPTILLTLAGVDTPESMDFRRDLLAQRVGTDHVLVSLYNTTSPESLTLREELAPNDKSPHEHVVVFLNTLKGNDSPRAMKLRRPFFGTEYELAALESLEGVDTPQSMRLRKLYLNSDIDRYRNSVAISLTNVNNADSAALWKQILPSTQPEDSALLSVLEQVTTPSIIPTLRRFWRSGRAIPPVRDRVTRLLSRQTSSESMHFREEVISQQGHAVVIGSLVFVATPESRKLRERLRNENQLSKIGFLQTLVGVSADWAMQERRAYASLPNADSDALAYSLLGVYTPEAIAFRRKYLAHLPRVHLNSYLDFTAFNRLHYAKVLKQGIINAAAASRH